MKRGLDIGWALLNLTFAQISDVIKSEKLVRYLTNKICVFSITFVIQIIDHYSRLKLFHISMIYFVFLMKAQVIRKCVNLHKFFFSYTKLGHVLGNHCKI